MSTRGFLVIEDENMDEAYVYLDGDAYPDQVEGIVTAFLNANTNGDLYGMTVQDKAESLVKATEDRRMTEYPKTYEFRQRKTTIEYSPWLKVVADSGKRNAAADIKEGALVFTLTYRYELFEGRRLKAERGTGKVRPRYTRA